MSMSAFAQTSVTVLQPHWVDSIEKTIIQEHRKNYPATVTCYSTNDSVVFVYTPNAAQSIEVYVKDYYVNDMIVSGDNVYFCGRHGFLDIGIYGCFNINDLFYGTGQISIVPYLFAGAPAEPVRELTRLTTIPKQDNTERIVCIGRCGTTANYPCMLEFESGLVVLSYLGGYVYNEKESFFDLDVVRDNHFENYLVTVGFITTHGRYINARVYDPNDLFSLSGLQDMCHEFSMDTLAARPWLDSGVVITNYGDGYFVTASYRNALGERDYIPSYHKLFTNIHLAKYSVTGLVAHSTSALLDNHELKLGLVNHRQVERLIYSNKSKSLVLLHTFAASNASASSEFCEFKYDALGNAGTLSFFGDGDYIKQGLSLYNNISNYVISGYNKNDLSTLKYEMETLGSNPKCIEGKKYEYERLPIIRSINYIKPFVYAGFVCNVSHPDIEKVTVPLFPECEK